MPRAAPCPCHSGRLYATCCAPVHRGESEPSDASSLVRARFSAFALGDVDFLWRTLHSEHADRGHHESKARAALRAASTSLKFMGLRIFEETPFDREGVALVLYLARVFRKGANVSFIELAELRREGGAIRYGGGRVLDAPYGSFMPGDAAPATLPSLTIDAFLDAYAGVSARRSG